MRVEVAAKLNGLGPEDIAVEVLLGRPEAGLASETPNRRRMRFERQLADTGEHLFAIDFTPEFFGRVEYRMRAFPHHELLTHPFELGLMVWGVSERGLRVLFASPELAPWARSGVSARSSAICRSRWPRGHRVRVLVPAYPALKQAFPGARRRCPVAAAGGAACGAAPRRGGSGTALSPLMRSAVYARPGNPYQTAEAPLADNPCASACSRALQRCSQRSQPDRLAAATCTDRLADGPGRRVPPYSKETPAGSSRRSTTGVQGIFAPSVMQDLAIPSAAFALDG